MKLVRILVIFAIVLPTIGWIGWRLFFICLEGWPRSHTCMKELAEIAIIKAGGAAVLEKEAKVVLANCRPENEEEWVMCFLRGDETNHPAIMKLHSLLSPDGHIPWLRPHDVFEEGRFFLNDGTIAMAVTNRCELPPHVVIRFGSHSHYEYIWIFDPAHVPLEKIGGVENLTGAVYLSQLNK